VCNFYRISFCTLFRRKRPLHTVDGSPASEELEQVDADDKMADINHYAAEPMHTIRAEPSALGQKIILEGKLKILWKNRVFCM